jgi:hypothetical protein
MITILQDDKTDIFPLWDLIYNELKLEILIQGTHIYAEE